MSHLNNIVAAAMTATMTVAMTAAMTAAMAAVLLKHYYDVLVGLLIGYRRCKM